MLEINTDNLKLAYKKLKSYIYYYNSSNFLKDKILEFEDWNSRLGMETKFNNLANSLLNDIEYLKENPNSLFKVEPPRNYYHPGYIVYPKKNTATSNGETINIDGINLFIDLEIKYHLVDVLYAMNLEEKFHQQINDNAYGNVVHEKAYENSFSGISMLDNTLLFENHVYQYKKWKNCLIKAFQTEENKYDYEDSLENVAIVKFDVKKCFYNTRFDFNEYDLGDGISSIMRNVYNYYKKIVTEKLQLEELATNQVLLPIGLVSSYVILNSIMSKVDNKLSEKTLAYGRYVDDFLMMISVDEFKQAKDEFLINHFPELLSMNKHNDGKEKLKLIVNDSLELELNKEKTLVKYYKKLKRKDIQDETYDFVSNSIDIDEIEDRKSNISTDEKNMQRIGYELNKINDWTELVKYCDELNNQEILNCYQLWKLIFSKIKELSPDIMIEQSEFFNELVDRIGIAINNVDIKLENDITDHLNKLKETLIKTLRNELDISIRINFDQTFLDHYLSGITQKDKINYIEDKNEFVYAFPIRITRREIMFYLGVNGFIFLNENNKNLYFIEVDRIYFDLNNYHIFTILNMPLSNPNDEKYMEVYLKMSFDSDLIRLSLTKEPPNTNDAYIIKKVKKIGETNKIKIALVNFALPEVSLKKEYEKQKEESEQDIEIINIYDMENYDIANESSKEANLNVIKRIIKKAKNKGAKFVVFPEFAVQFDDSMDVLNYCGKLHISLITGLTHKLDEFTNKAYNITMIYDDRLGVCLCHYKRYLAPLEKDLLLNNKFIGVSVKNYPYFVIDDELLKYSSMTCYEATNIDDRALFHNEVEAMFLPVYNFDTPYFSNIVESFSRDISAYVIQSNANCYGDSRITAPTDIKNMDIVKLKGGINSYFVIGEIDKNMKKIRGDYEKSIDDIYDNVESKGLVEDADIKKLNGEKKTFKKANKFNYSVFKSFSAGTNK